MLNIVNLINRNHSWEYRVRILVLCGWTNAQKSTRPSDHVFWTDGMHTLHYRASFLADLSFERFYNLVYKNDLSAC